MKPLMNINASCFMNTVLQSLFTCKQFNNEVLKSLAANKDKTIANAVIRAYCLLSTPLVTDQTVRVDAFVQAIRTEDARWKGMCDSLEFLEYILNALEQITGSSLC
jgi:ubiquitin C-terminal hydrolase